MVVGFVPHSPDRIVYGGNLFAVIVSDVRNRIVHVRGVLSFVDRVLA